MRRGQGSRDFQSELIRGQTSPAKDLRQPVKEEIIEEKVIKVKRSEKGLSDQIPRDTDER